MYVVILFTKLLKMIIIRLTRALRPFVIVNIPEGECRVVSGLSL